MPRARSDLAGDNWFASTDFLSCDSSVNGGCNNDEELGIGNFPGWLDMGSRDIFLVWFPRRPVGLFKNMWWAAPYGKDEYDRSGIVAEVGLLNGCFIDPYEGLIKLEPLGKIEMPGVIWWWCKRVELMAVLAWKISPRILSLFASSFDSLIMSWGEYCCSFMRICEFDILSICSYWFIDFSSTFAYSIYFSFSALNTCLTLLLYLSTISLYLTSISWNFLKVAIFSG